MVWINSFSIDKFQVTKLDWDAVRLWAGEKGYNDLSVGRGVGKQPVGCITWYDAVKFCNACSELAELKPVYYTSSGDIYKIGNIDDINMDNDADGYRLPTADEWLFATRGGTSTTYFWGDRESPDSKDYACDLYEYYENNGIKGIGNITKPVGTKKPNQYGLYDMIGNSCEWCFDEKMGFCRALKGGSVALDSILDPSHTAIVPPMYKSYETGMRLVCNKRNAMDTRKIAQISSFYGKEETPKPVYPKTDIQSTAQEFCEALGEDIYSKELKGLIESGKIKEAFKSYRDTKLEEFKKNYIITEAVPSVVRTIEELTEKKDIFEFDFFSGGSAYDIYAGMPELDVAADRYAATMDKKYLDLYFLMLRACVVRHKAEFDIQPDGVYLRNTDLPVATYWSNGFMPGKRTLRIMTSVARIAKCLDDFDDFPEELFIRLAIHLNTVEMYPMIKDGREKISNQTAHLVSWMLSIANIFSEFKYSQTITGFAVARWRDRLTNYIIHPDGSVTEQAYHYIHSLLHAYFEVAEKFKGQNLLSGIEECLVNTSRMLVASIPPVSEWPVTAKNQLDVVPPVYKGDKMEYFDYLYNICRPELDWAEYTRIKELIKNPNGDKPRFNSVFFPYGGTAVIRSGWEREAQYVFFFAPRAGAGHTAEAIGDIQLQAYGRRMLRTGGYISYGQVQNLEEEQRPLLPLIDKYIEKDSAARNTVMVDGKGQSRLRLGDKLVTKRYDTATGYRYCDSVRLTYCEGEYHDGYYSCDDVSHKRELLFLKKYGIWVVVDRMYAETEHTYSQVWHFPLAGENYTVTLDGKKYSWELDGYKRSDIFCEGNMLYTRERNAPNVALHHMGDIQYERHSAELNPVKGWSSYEGTHYFKYIPVEEVYCNFSGKNAVLITVIEPTPDEGRRMTDIIKTENEYRFNIDGEEIAIIKDDVGRVEVVSDDECIVLDAEKDKYYAESKGEITFFNAPSGMNWKKKDGYYYPVYEYENCNTNVKYE